MKKLLLFFAALSGAMILNGQIIRSENFDSYTVGNHMTNSDSINWTTWSNDPIEDGFISNLHAASGTNSLMISKNNDQVWLLGDSTTGKYELSFKIYVPADSVGYFNVLHNFAGGFSEWSNEVTVFPHDSILLLSVGGNDTAFVPFTFETWHNIYYSVDLTNDFAFMMYDADTIFSWPWSLDGDGNTGLLQIGAMDFYGYDFYSLGNVRLYLDDLKYEKIISINTEDIYEDSHLIIFPNPVNNQLKISTTKAIKTLKILNINGSVIENYNVNDETFNLNVENLASGLYYLQINYGTSIAIRKFIKQ